MPLVRQRYAPLGGRRVSQTRAGHRLLGTACPLSGKFVRPALKLRFHSMSDLGSRAEVVRFWDGLYL